MSNLSGMSKTDYEKKQEFNWVVSWLHSFRFRNVIGVFDELARTVVGRPIKVVEIGCAHAKLFPLLNDRFQIDYTGIELQERHAAVARERYQGHANFRVFTGRAEDELKNCRDADIVIALETLEHIPEHVVVRVVEAVAKIRPKLFICSVPIEIGPAIWFKNVGSFLTGYMRHQEYTWADTFWAGLDQLDKLPPHDVSHIGFNWRWLAQTIRHNLKIRELRTFPSNVLPAAFSTSVFIIAEPREPLE